MILCQSNGFVLECLSDGWEFQFYSLDLEVLVVANAIFGYELVACPVDPEVLLNCILLGYQLLTYFDNVENPHQDLQTPELTEDILFITKTYDTPHLPRENPYPVDWLLRKDLARGIREFQKLVLKIPESRQTQYLEQAEPRWQKVATKVAHMIIQAQAVAIPLQAMS
ncbi:unnamed protein product [Penicillium camemberti]|uniref:Str. FM013 n=1 Tax=Penicillium camemberti (strain FM 013) TaxID=1429867 RepID=A0A0G4P8L7_PENC3|nr:unnamed protein product [Penicillium camemberti]